MVRESSFPSSAWERPGAKLCFALDSDGKQSFRTCVPKQSLGTRGTEKNVPFFREFMSSRTFWNRTYCRQITRPATKETTMYALTMILIVLVIVTVGAFDLD